MKIAIAFLLMSLHCLCAVPVDKKDTPIAPVPKQQKSVPKEPQVVPKSAPKATEPEPKPVHKAQQPVPKVSEPVPKPVHKASDPAPKPVHKASEPAPKPVHKSSEPAPKPIPKEPQPVPKPIPLIDCLIQLLKKDAPGMLQNLGKLLCDYRVAQQEQNIALFMNFLNRVENVLAEVGCSLNNLFGRKVVVTAQDAEYLSEQVAVVLFQFVEDIIARVMKILEEIPIVRDFINDAPLTEDIRNLACTVLESVLQKISHILTIVADFTGGLTKVIEGL